jgi:hypothetical protein
LDLGANRLPSECHRVDTNRAPSGEKGETARGLLDEYGVNPWGRDLRYRTWGRARRCRSSAARGDRDQGGDEESRGQGRLQTFHSVSPKVEEFLRDSAQERFRPDSLSSASDLDGTPASTTVGYAGIRLPTAWWIRSTPEQDAGCTFRSCRSHGLPRCTAGKGSAAAPILWRRAIAGFAHIACNP